MQAFITFFLLGTSAVSVSAAPSYDWKPYSKTPETCNCPVPWNLWQPRAPLAAGSSPLPPVSPGLSLKRVTVGVGYQLYNCANLAATAAPASVGARAHLYDGNCAAAGRGRLHAVPSRIVDARLNDRAARSFLRSAGERRPKVVAEHYFKDPTTPEFHFTDGSDDAFVGMGAARANVTERPPAIAWLKLSLKTGRENESNDVAEVFRLVTAGGVAPKTCGRHAGQRRLIEVPYASEYWFYN